MRDESAPPGWLVVESFVESKAPDAVSEDVVVDTGDFVAIIDGATDETGGLFADRTGGRFAAEVLRGAIRTLSPEATAREFVDRLTGSLSESLEPFRPLSDETRWPVASVVCFSPSRGEVWRVGDCEVAIDGTHHPHVKRVDAAAYAFRAAINSALLAKGSSLSEIVTNDPGAEAARSLYDLQQHLANTVGRWGYGSIDGREVPDEYVEVFDVTDASRIVLTSDGYPTCSNSLREAEETLHLLVAADPAAVGHLWKMGKPCRPGYNAPDDRAYVRLERQRGPAGVGPLGP